MRQMEAASGGQQTAGIDWNEVHRRVEAAAAVMKGELSQEEKSRILKARARAVARETEPEDTPGRPLDVLEFVVAEERYGIETAYIREVYPLGELVPVPCTPAFVLGIANVRGKTVSVLDIRQFFDLPRKGLAELDKIVIVQSGTMELGIRADAVLGIRPIPLDGLVPPLPTLTGIREDYVKGVTVEPMALLDMERLLNDERIIVHDEIE